MKISATKKVIVVILSTLFGLICLFMMCYLGSMLNDPQKIREGSRPAIRHVNESFQSFGVDVKIDILDFYFMKVGRAVVIFLIVVLVIILILSIVSCMSEFIDSKRLTIIYVVILSIILLFHIIVFTLVMRGRSTFAPVKDFMRESIREGYNGTRSTDPTSLSWNFVMFSLQCCGVDSYRDFEGASLWKRERNITLGEFVVPIEVDMPVACCKHKHVVELQLLKRAFSSKATYVPNHPAVEVMQCAQSNKTAQNNKNISCYEASWDVIELYTMSPLFILANLVFIAITATSIVLSVIKICLC